MDRRIKKEIRDLIDDARDAVQYGESDMALDCLDRIVMLLEEEE